MADYDEILNSEIEADNPLREGTMFKIRDNPEAIAEGAATVPNAKRPYPPGFRNPTATAQATVVAHQGASQRLGDLNTTVRFFQAIVCVPGVYTFAGTRSTTSQNTVNLYINNVDDGLDDSTASFTHQMTLSTGDVIRVDVENTGSSEITLTNFRLLSEYAVPMCQCQFNRFEPNQSA